MLTPYFCTFELFVDDDRCAVPTLHLIEAPDVAAATTAAERILSESLHHRGAELCLDGQRMAGLGSFALRRLPVEARARVAQRD